MLRLAINAAIQIAGAAAADEQSDWTVVKITAPDQTNSRTRTVIPLTSLFTNRWTLLVPAALSIAWLAGKAEAAETTKPNIVFIMADDLGPGWVDYGFLGKWHLAGEGSVKTNKSARIACAGNLIAGSRKYQPRCRTVSFEVALFIHPHAQREGRTR